MTPLEGTIEIVRAVVSSGNVNSSKVLMEEKVNQDFLKQVGNIYNKLKELEKYKGSEGQ
jgi:hypothetical protein